MTNNNDNNRKSLRLLNQYTIIVVLIWILIVLASLFWNLYRTRRWTKDIAVHVARAYFEKDMAFRRWGASHGGVYAPVSDWSPPNPYLKHIPERDITTPSGKKLTLINPAYMFRQMLTEFAPRTGVVERITSLKVLNPDNAPDDWEKEALQRLEKGDREVATFTEFKGKPYIRFMRPFITEKPCLKCHAFQGYMEGDIRGGLSISLPMEPYLAIEADTRRTTVLSHLLILAFGLFGIGFGSSRIRKHLLRQMEMEDEIKQQNKFITTIINSLSHPFYVIDVNTYEIVMANTATLAEEEAPSQTCYSLTHRRNRPCDGVEHPCPIEEVKKQKRMYTVEHIHYFKDGTPRFVQLFCYPVFDHKGEVVQVIEYAVDITEQRKLEAQLQQSQRLECIGMLAGGIAHDFNNLLTAILGYCEIALTDLPPKHPVREYIQMIQYTGERASHLTRQLLAFSRKQDLQMKTVKINSIVEGIANILRRILGENIQLELRTASETGVIKADPGQIEQVIMNLAINARDAMPEGGKLIIETSDVFLDEEYARTHEGVSPGPYVMLAVSDTGEGIPPEMQKRIFEPFFTTKAKGKGTGLGLATVFGIIKQHNGHIWVYSESGRGTTFKVYIPVTKESATAKQAIEKSDDIKKEDFSPRQGTETILVVDDEPVVVSLLRDSLEPLGYRILEASCAEEAIQISDEFEGRIDLLLTDIVMPDKNGKELAEIIKTRRPEIKIVFMSGYTEGSILNQGALPPETCFIQKPLVPKKLFSILRQVLDK